MVVKLLLGMSFCAVACSGSVASGTKATMDGGSSGASGAGGNVGVLFDGGEPTVLEASVRIDSGFNGPMTECSVGVQCTIGSGHCQCTTSGRWDCADVPDARTLSLSDPFEGQPCPSEGLVCQTSGTCVPECRCVSGTWSCSSADVCAPPSCPPSTPLSGECSFPGLRCGSLSCRHWDCEPVRVDSWQWTERTGLCH